jgi:hypothetical protein
MMMIKNVLRPHYLLDPWRDSFVTAMRLRRVTGRRIGDALAQVDAHCADGGEEPELAFGDPVDYATKVAEEVRPEDRSPSLSPLRAGLLGLGVLLGVLTLLSGVAGLASGDPAVLSVGNMVGAAVGTAGAAVLAGTASRLQGQRRWTLWFGVICWLTMGGMALSMTTWTSTAIQLGSWLSVAVAVVLLGATWASPWATQPERVVDPLTGGDSMPTPRWSVLVLRWFLPVTLAGVVLLILLVPVH